MAIVLRACPNRSRGPKWTYYSSYLNLGTYTNLQGCKQPFKIKKVTLLGKFRIFSRTIERQYQM